MSNAVTTTLILKANDQATPELQKVNDSLEASAKATQRAAMHAEDFAEKSGDMEKGVKGVKDILGALGAGPLTEIADKFGGIEAIIKGFGPTLGPVALALAAAGAAAGYLYQQTEEARKKAIDNEIAQINLAKTNQELLAARYVKNVDILGVEKEIATSKDAQAKVMALLGQMAEAEVALKTAQKDKDDEAEKSALRKLATLREQVKEGLIQIKDLQSKEERDKTAEARSLRYQAEQLSKQREIDNMMDVRARRTAQNVQLQAEINKLEERRIQLQSQAVGTGDKALAAAKELLDVTKRLFAALDKQKADLKAQDKEDQDARAKRLADAEKYRAKLEEIRKARRQAEQDSLTARAAMATDPRVKQQLEFNAQFAKFEAERADIEKKYAKDKITLRMALQALDDKALATEAQRLAAEKAKADQAKLANAQAQADAMAKLRQAEIEQTADPAQKYALQVLDLQAQKERELDQIRANNALSEQTRQLQMAAVIETIDARKIAMQNAEAERRKKEDADQMTGAISVANTIIGALEQEGASRREIAALRAAIEVAEVYASFPNIPAMISHGIAAALYAKAALTATPTATGGQSAASGAIAQASGTTMSGATGTGGNVQIVLSRGFVVGTPAQVGKAVAGALGAAKGTGFAMPKGV